MMARHLLAALFLSLLLNAVPAHAGTAEAPEVSDATGDAALPQLDIAAAWFEATDTDLLVHIQRGPDAGAPPAIVQCQEGQCVGAGVSLRVLFTVLKPDGTPAPELEDYESSYVLVRIGPDATIASSLGYYTAGTATPEQSVNVTIDGAHITAALPRASAAIAIPVGAAPGAYRITQPYAVSYVMPCAPDEGCLNLAAPNDAVASGWDRAPDADYGLDYVFPNPPPATQEAAAAAADGEAETGSTTTVTTVETATHTVTATETETFTSEPLPLHVEEKGAPGTGMVVVALSVLAALAVRRRWA